MTQEKKPLSLNVTNDEVRFIAVLRAIKEFGKEHLISQDEVGVALALLRATVEDLEKLEGELKPGELKLFLRGFITGLGASTVQKIPYETSTPSGQQFNGYEVGAD